MTEGASSWIQVLAILLTGSVVSAIVQALAMRRKVKTDSSQTFVETASMQRESLVSDNDRLRASRDREADRADELDKKLRKWWARADAFMVWARRQAQRNTEAGIEDPMPPLYPPDNE